MDENFEVPEELPKMLKAYAKVKTFLLTLNLLAKDCLPNELVHICMITFVIYLIIV